MQARIWSPAAQQFRAKFFPAFRWPRGRITSEVFADFQIDYELATDALAGPMHNYYERGNVDYVFSGRNAVFQKIKTRTDLIRWCREIVEGLKRQLLTIPAHNKVEISEQQLLLSRISCIERLVDLFDQCLREESSTQRSRAK